MIEKDLLAATPSSSTSVASATPALAAEATPRPASAAAVTPTSTDTPASPTTSASATACTTTATFSADASCSHTTTMSNIPTVQLYADSSVFDIHNCFRHHWFLSRDWLISQIATAQRTTGGPINWVQLKPESHTLMIRSALALCPKSIPVAKVKRVMFAHILEVLNEYGPMVDFYSLKPSVKAPRRRTHKPKGKTGQQQLLAEAAGKALAHATPTPPSTVKTLPEASTSLPPPIPSAPASPPPPPVANTPVEEEEIDILLGRRTPPSPHSFTPPPLSPRAELWALLNSSIPDKDSTLDPDLAPLAIPRQSTRQPTRGKSQK